MYNVLIYSNFLWTANLQNAFTFFFSVFLFSQILLFLLFSSATFKLLYHFGFVCVLILGYAACIFCTRHKMFHVGRQRNPCFTCTCPHRSSGCGLWKWFLRQSNPKRRALLVSKSRWRWCGDDSSWSHYSAYCLWTAGLLLNIHVRQQKINNFLLLCVWNCCYGSSQNTWTEKGEREPCSKKQQQQRFTVHCIVLCKGEKKEKKEVCQSR